MDQFLPKGFEIQLGSLLLLGGRQGLGDGDTTGIHALIVAKKLDKPFPDRYNIDKRYIVKRYNENRYNGSRYKEKRYKLIRNKPKRSE